MSNRKLVYFVLLILAVAFTSCSKSDNQETPRYSYFQSTIKSADVTKADLLANIPIQLPSSAALLLPNVKVKTVAIRYSTTDASGSKVTASGLITYPEKGVTKGIVVGQHYTFTRNADVPSQRMAAIESLFALIGYAVVSADYIGYGESAQLVHPYLHYETTGRATADMLLAAEEYFNSIGVTLPKTPVTVVGYSQGGYAALAFEKMAETSYSNRINVGKVFAGGGAYDLVATYKALVENGTTSLPCSVPLLLLGLDSADKLNLDFTQLFKEPLLSNYNSWILSKTKTTDEINTAIGSNSLSDFLTAQALDISSSSIKKLLPSLEKNSVTEGWTPKAKIMLAFGTNDDIVPPANSRLAYDAFTAKGVDVTLLPISGKGHVEASIDFYLAAFTELYN